ncbi:magnetosome protein MamEO [Candidatus Desulfarcum epimagneticum]|uniref:Probable membrane transporter protein n=1 Tax=uncultured Desulfobacteraceae bacterium TaxID=218296 RepID=A0A484HKK1_9BACT|nr:magnetosome protein MamEO [uncultured Desulfobacteraceae bacterium]
MLRHLCALVLFMLSASHAWPAQTRANDPLPGLQEDINSAVAIVRPSVAGIVARKKSGADGPGGALLWFDSIGSGVILDEQGHILTNYHVVDNARKIDVTLWRSPPHTYTATIIKKDPSMDLALLKIQSADRLIPARFGDSSKTRIGDLVLSVGSPFGFDHTVSMGAVSAAKRDLFINGKTYAGMIQTDAVINEGNSGGPLVDIHGRVVGINTAIYSPGAAYIGIGFAIPINQAKHFFTPFTGAVPAAVKFPAINPLHKFPIDMNKGRPNDFNHTTFRDCAQCHIIQVKSPMIVGHKRPHPFVGACDKCHIVERTHATGAPVTVAARGPGTLDLSYHSDSWSFFKHILLKALPLFFVSSIIFSLLGLGGGFFYVPILIMCHLDFHTASTTSLLMITTGSLSALYVFKKSGMVDLKLVSALGTPAMIGSFAGGILSDAFNVYTLYILFSITLFAASYMMAQDKKILEGRYYRLEASPLVMHRRFNGHEYSIDLVLAGFLVLSVGFLGGLLGIAGGWFLVPMLVLLFSLPMRIAVATSSFIVPLNGLAGFAGHGFVGHIDWQLALPLCALAAIGAQIGARISIKTETNVLRVIFAFILSLVAVWMLTKNVFVF